MFKFLSFFKKQPSKVALSKTEVCLFEPLTVSVLPDPDGITFVKTQLELDINAKAKGWRPIPFTLFELLEMEASLFRKPQTGLASVAFTYPECALLARYAGYYFVRARDIEDFERASAYNRFVFSLLDPSNLIKLPL
ncbi:hypothetical protein GCM10028819_32440 [Spirosoma humi]